MKISNILTAAAAATLASAHPGHDHQAERAARRQALAQNSRRDLSHCDSIHKANGYAERQAARRHEMARSLRLARGIQPRHEYDLNRSHHNFQDANFTYWTDPAAIFAMNSSAALAPEEIPGPFWVKGEYVRGHIAEDQQGVPLLIDTQVLDYETCEPVSGKYVEIWHANATGLYSGVKSDLNGNGDSTLDLTWLRGLQQTNADGITQFQTIFPGHYAGRAVHVHIFVHKNASMLSNGTIQSEYGYHVGQMFFDMDLITAVQENYPYTENTQSWLPNDEDDILADELPDTDPIMEYVMLGDDISDGIMAWLSFGINMTNTHWASPAAEYLEGGGVSLTWDEATDIGNRGGGSTSSAAGSSTAAATTTAS